MQLELNVITLNGKCKTKQEILISIIKKLKESGYIIDEDKFLLDIMSRESMASTVIDDIIAIPHAQSDFVMKPVIAFFKNETEVLWEESTGSFAQIVFMFGVSNNEKDRTFHLKMLQQVAIRLASREVIHKIKFCDNINELSKIMDMKILP